MTQRPNDPTTKFLHYLPISLLALSFFGAYFDTFFRLVKSWASYDQAHTAILIAISLFLLWTERGRLKELSPQPALKTGSAVALLGCLMLIAGKLSNTALLQYVSLPVTITGITILVGGFSYIKVVWLPIVYLFFVFGLFDEILGSVSIYLQYAAALTASGLLKLTGIPVELNGLIIQLPHISLEVERGCSGQKHILALLALAVPVVYLRLHGWFPRFLLIAIAFFIGVFGNGIRIAIIGLWSINHPDSIHGPHDIFYVSFIFFFGTVLFLFAIWVAESFWPRKKRHESTPIMSNGSNHTLSNRWSVIQALVTGMLILFATAIIFHAWEPRNVTLREPLSALSSKVGGWSGQDSNGSDSLLKDTNPDSSLYRTFINSKGQQIGINIAYFEAQNEIKRVVSYQTTWLYNYGVEFIPLFGDNNALRIGKALRRNNNKELETIYFWFDIDGMTTADRYTAKIKTIIGAATKRRTNGAIVAISFPQSGNISDAEQRLFLQQIFPLIRNHLKQTGLYLS